MTAFLERVPVSRVGAEAAKAEVHPGRWLVAAVTAVLYLVGWLPSLAVRAAWLGARWTFAAVKVGAMDPWAPRRVEDAD